MKRLPVLYISYDGMLEPLGQSQVIAYIEQLSDQYAFDLISFEKPADLADDARRGEIAARLAKSGIRWHPLRYHKSPSVPATAYDLAVGTALAIRIARKSKAKIVHARSYVAAIMALSAKKATGARFLFDMRGLWADERVDGDLWRADGLLFKTAKSVERKLLLSADATVTLTEASVREIRNFDYVDGDELPLFVIPTCADLTRFRPQPGIGPEVFTLGYLGSIGTWYLFDDVLRLFRVIEHHRADARLLIVNRNEQNLIRNRLENFDIDSSRVELTSAPHDEVPDYVSRMSVGAAIIKPAYSKLASAPTKLAEYLGCGVPCIGNDGVGDMHEILEGERVGVSLRTVSGNEIERAASRFFSLHTDPDLPERCRRVAVDRFSLRSGVNKYRAVYAYLLGTTHEIPITGSNA